jgi:2-phospho-L-lactate guanylyltransferase
VNAAGKTCAVLPLKPFDDAKERLATGLDPAQRKLIAEAMARDVVAALSRCTEIDEIVVISAEAKAGEIAGETASEILSDERTGHSDAAALGVAWAIDHGCDRVALVPGDCPLLDPEELDDLIQRCRDQRLQLAVVPDRMGSGTNALVISPPDAIRPSFGPGSRERHLAFGLAAGLRTAAIEVPTLAHDLDTAEDLLELAESVSSGDHDAVNTEQAIATLMTDRRRLPGGYAR